MPTVGVTQELVHKIKQLSEYFYEEMLFFKLMFIIYTVTVHFH